MSRQAGTTILVLKAITALLALIVMGAMTGCGVFGTQATLTIYTQPEGAYIIEQYSGTPYGIAPVTVVYNAAMLHSIKTDGCFMVHGFEARWVSGVTASLEQIKICGNVLGDYQITFSRDPDAPGLEKDMQFALEVRSILAQQRQAAAAETASTAALLGLFESSDSNLQCRSRQVGNSVYTDCN